MVEAVENIIDRASTLFFELGVRSVSMDDIARELGISKKTLYQSFGSKEALVQGTVDKFINEEQLLLQHFREQSIDALDEMIQIGRYIITMFSRIKPVLLHDLEKYYTTTWKAIHDMQSCAIAEVIETNIRRGILERIYRSDIDVSIVTILYVQKSMALTSNDLFADDDYDRQELIRQHIKYHLYGILSEEGRDLLENRKIFE